MAEVVQLYEYFQECNNYGGIQWFIQYTPDLENIMQIVCTDDECGRILENKELGGG
jgi:hypothetical protein